MLDDSLIDSGGHMNVSGMVEDGIRLARRGQRAEAETIFRRLIQIAPENEDGWLWMAWLADTREESLRYLREGLRFSPDGPSLREGVAWVETHKPSAIHAAMQDAAPTASSPAPGRRKETAKVARQSTDTPRRTAVKDTAEASSPIPKVPRRKGTARPASGRFDLSRVLEGFRSLSVTAISITAVAVLIGVATLVARQAISETPAVAAMVLPTPVLDATPTPGVENVSRPLWTRVEIALGQEDWGAAVAALDQIRAVDPQNLKARERLSAALYQRALDSIAKNELELAKRDLDRAVTLDADSPNLQSTRRDVELYRSAVESYLEQDWAKSV
ncbi:MAG: tetratricopeptide repeat protein, partial [Anaerolineae bacterium]